MPRFSFFMLLFLLPALACAETILVMGDSLSAGYGLRQQDAWPNLLAQRLAERKPGWTVVNASISGETSAGGRSRIEQALKQSKPAVVIVALGANDGLRGLPVATLRENLAAMLATAQRAGARTLLIGMRLPPNYGADYTAKFHAAFGEVARSAKSAYVPFLLEGFADRRELFQADNVHPVAAAQPRILDNVWPALEPLLKSTTGSRAGR